MNHAIHMLLIMPPHRRASRGGGRSTLSIAYYDCGWQHRAQWNMEGLRNQDAAIAKHRQESQTWPPPPA